MIVFIVSFLAGFITVLAPCVLPVLPVILGGTLNESNYKKIMIIILSFVVSIVLFTFLLKVSTALISVDQSVWKILSGIILIGYGLLSLFPNIWEHIKNLLHISGTGVVKSKNEGIRGQILLGASLGPIFSTCSPTYSLIIATILPLSLRAGTVSIFLYAFGLGVAVLLVAIFGRTIIKRLHIFSKNDSRFKQILAVLIIMVGIFVITGYDKYLESMILGRTGNSIIELEENILKSVDIASPAFCQK